MNDVMLHVTLAENGVLVVSGLPFKKGEELDVVLRRSSEPTRVLFTGKALAESALVSLWEQRIDIGDTTEFARKLREEAQLRDLY